MGNDTQLMNLVEPTKVWNTTFINLFLVNLTFNMGQNMSNSLMPVYADHLGASTVAVGVVMSAFAISAVAFRFLSSPIMDTYNRKYIVLISSLVMATAFLGFSLSQSVGGLIAFRLLQGCGMAFGNACCLAMVPDMIPRDSYASGIGYFSMAMVISAAIGPYVGLMLVENVGFSATFLVNTGFMLICAFLASRLKFHFVRTTKLVLSLNNIIAKEVLVPSVLLLCVVTGMHFGNSFLILYASSRGVANIGLYFTVNAVTMLATRSFVGKLMDRHGAFAVVLPALFCNIMACFVVSFSHTLWHFLVAAVVNAMGTGVCQPAFQALSMKKVTSNRRGAASSTNYIGMDIAALIGPLAGGLVAQTFGYSVMYRFQAIPFAIGVAVLFLFRNWIKETETTFSGAAS